MQISKPRHFLWFSRIVRYLLTRSPASRSWNRILHFFTSLWSLLKRKRHNERDNSKPWSPSDADAQSICNDRRARIYASAEPLYKADISTSPSGQNGSTPSTSSMPPQQSIIPLQERTPSISGENDSNPDPSALGPPGPENRSWIRSTKPERTSFSQTRPADRMLDAIGSDLPMPITQNQFTFPPYAKPLIVPISASSFKRYERNIFMYALWFLTALFHMCTAKFPLNYAGLTMRRNVWCRQ
jgi:hypothetical protein